MFKINDSPFFRLFFFRITLCSASKLMATVLRVEYLYYDEACCETQSITDKSRHCLESFQIAISKLIDDLNTTLQAMSICNSANSKHIS